MFTQRDYKSNVCGVGPTLSHVWATIIDNIKNISPVLIRP